MICKVLMLLGFTISLSLQSAFSAEHKEKEDEKSKISTKMHKQLKGELAIEKKASTCAENDKVCLEKEIAEAKELMQKKLKDKKTN